jgi:uncharacterized lipoprotein YajG
MNFNESKNMLLKLTLIIPVVLLLAGCQGDTRIKVEDNSPDKYERLDAMRTCTGQYVVDEAEESLRIACTQAVYGGYK